jgi:hypothetical protein
MTARTIAALVALGAFGLCRPSEAGPAAPFGPDIVWRSNDIGAVADCNVTHPGQDSLPCLAGKMRAGGATPAAIAFAGRLNAMDNPGWADSFKAYGKVAVVDAVYPFRANNNGGELLVNGTPSIVDTESFELSKADKRRSDYRALMAHVPQADLNPYFPFQRREALAHGGARFIFTGNFATCHACEPVATGYLGFDFDASGRFLGTRLVSVGPPPKA